MKNNFCIMFLILIVTLAFGVGCDNNKTQNSISNETRASAQVTTKAETQATIQADIPPTIYISSISNSSRTIHYSLTIDFLISKDALAIDSSCRFYNNLDQEISFTEFSTIVQASNKQYVTVKCNIKINSNNNIIEAHITQ